ncbi:MAG TPA: hypothetical protein PLD45_07970, partial [Spirochaetales bacterium]|nr:hypothetical protein [Spirochaetales bacterium]
MNELTVFDPEGGKAVIIYRSFACSPGRHPVGSVTELVETGRGEGVRVQVFFLCSDVRDRSTGVQLGPGEAREVVRLLFA